MNHIETIIKAEKEVRDYHDKVTKELNCALGYRVLFCYHEGEDRNFRVSIWKTTQSYKGNTAVMQNYVTGRRWEELGEFTPKELDAIEEILYATK